MDESTTYYDQNAAEFVDDTLKVDMSPLYNRFLPLVPPGGDILDAGCGSGRDAWAFRQLGYGVTAFDASPRMAETASSYLGEPVRVLRFQDIDWRDRFDGIWACASLLHVPNRELPSVTARLGEALRAGGVIYGSFKYGKGEREHRGRRFTDLDEPGLASLLDEVAHLGQQLAPSDVWITGDLRPGRESERWLNFLLRK